MDCVRGGCGVGRQGFGGLLRNEQWNTLIDAGRIRVFLSGEQIIHQGQPDDSVYFLDRGNVKVSVTHSDGIETLVALRGAGEALGEFSALSGLPRTATVRASGGRCTTYALKGDRFRGLIRSMDLDRLLWKHIVRRQEESEGLRAELLALNPRQRLAASMLRFSTATAPGHGEAGHTRELRLSQWELVGVVGRSRSWIQEELRRLRRDGVVSTGREVMVIHDVERLRFLATPRE
ncbi:Crp/Fnr family transcriptional regulator [Nocardiopsis sp. NPDC006832]|uniref:Crp/Fnr family transcriptional regulator n=1 Tax=Nocardiopsis sp. NPDC006832 TaxID=3157188 RepID=UPI0033C1D663